jgi:hypothetical protein
MRLGELALVTGIVSLWTIELAKEIVLDPNFGFLYILFSDYGLVNCSFSGVWKK